MNFVIRGVAAEDRPYVLASWRESHKQSPEARRVPWDYYKSKWGAMINRLLDDKSTVVIGAYTDAGQLVSWLAMTRGKRVNTLHWVHTRYELDGVRLRRNGMMTAMIAHAALGSPFVYTMRGAKRKFPTRPDGTRPKSLDEVLAAHLGSKGIVATYVPLAEWL